MIDLSCYYGFCNHGSNCSYFFINYLKMKTVPRPEKKEKPEENTFTINEPGHVYTLSNGDKINFMKKGEKGTTNEEIISVLLDRMNHLNKVLPCDENLMVIVKLMAALKFLNIRTLVRVAQRVEGTEKNHDPQKAQEYLAAIKSNTL